MPLNLDDIARIAGVSRATVSRVINDHPDVSVATREKVLRVIEENKYHPNLAARMLVTQRTQIIGIVVHNLLDAFNSAYATILVQGIHGTAVSRDYATLLWWGETGVEEDLFSPRVLQQNRLMDGVILATTTVDMSLIDQMIELGVPFVMTERTTRYQDKISYVTIDNVAAAITAVEHLHSIGRRRIAHITGPLNNADGLDRLEGYRQALERLDLPYDDSLVVNGAFNRKSGYAAMNELLERHVQFDAVFAGNDDTAAGALRAMLEAHLSVPDDVALVGFDDLPLALDIMPALTTIRQPIRERGGAATALLLDILEGRIDSPQRIILPTELVIRDSCGASRSSNHEV